MAAVLLKRAWSSVVARSPSPASDPGKARSSLAEEKVEVSFELTSLGDFDCVPTDVLFQILRFLGPKHAARSATVCRGWKVVVYENRLWMAFLQSGDDPWDSVIFSETHLRAGPRKMYFDHPSQLSFMEIYAQRASIPGSVIIDGGAGYCKYGWSKYTSPSGHCATFLEFGNIETPMYSRLRHFFATIYSRMQVKPSNRPVIVSIPICNTDDTESARASRMQLRETICTVLFDLNVPAVCAIDQAILALYSARRTSGIVVNIGFHATSIVPVLHGQVMHEVGVEVVGQGALKVTGFLRELMQRRNMNFGNLYTVRTIKEKLCYVATDYEAELRKNTEASCEVPGEGWFTLSKERFQAPEILFRPQIGGVQSMSLHRAVSLCMDHCADEELEFDDGWFKTVVVTGGTSLLPGLPDRLEKELHNLYPPSVSEGIKVIPSPYGGDAAWFGGKIVGNVSTFLDAWCITKKQFREKKPQLSSVFMGRW